MPTLRKVNRHHRRPRGGAVQKPTYIAKFEGGELDGRTQPMYGKSRTTPREVIEMGAWYNNVTRREVDFYVCINPNQRIETIGETRVYRYEPNHSLGLEAA